MFYVFIVAAYGKSWFWDYIENKGTKKEVILIQANLITSIFDGLMDQLICLSESETWFNESQCCSAKDERNILNSAP